jgi:outer membrane biosynthesis protein TonB
MIMEKHKLIQLILKDLEELNEITASLHQSQDISKFELNIALSKSKLVSQEFEFLKEISEAQNNTPMPERQETTITTPILPSEKIEEKVKEELSKPEENEIKPENTPNNTNIEPEQASEKEIAETPEAPREKNSQEQTPEPTTGSSSNEKEESIEEESDKLKTLGENFVKGKSLNDLILASNSLDKRLASSPIEKLETAIGLNDRFQYTRELFDNDPALFHRTIRSIDQSDNLDDAVSYLNSNFKWKKTDTSIQFAQLVKRRFTN